jgi:hypothetical protein
MNPTNVNINNVNNFDVNSDVDSNFDVNSDVDSDIDVNSDVDDDIDVNNVDNCEDNYINFDQVKYDLEELFFKKYGKNEFDNAFKSVVEDVCGALCIFSDKYNEMLIAIKDEKYKGSTNLISDYIYDKIVSLFLEKYDIDLDDKYNGIVIIEYIDNDEEYIYALRKLEIFMNYDFETLSEEVNIMYNIITNFIKHVFSKEKVKIECIEIFSIYKYMKYFDFIEKMKRHFVTYQNKDSLNIYLNNYMYKNKNLMILICKILDITDFLSDYMNNSIVNLNFRNTKINMRRKIIPDSNNYYQTFLESKDNMELCNAIFDMFTNSSSIYEIYKYILNANVYFNKLNNQSNDKYSVFKDSIIDYTLKENELINLSQCKYVLHNVFETFLNVLEPCEGIYSVISSEFNKFLVNNTLESEIFEKHDKIDDMIKICDNLNNNFKLFNFRTCDKPEEMIEACIYQNILNILCKKYNTTEYYILSMFNMLITFYYMYYYDDIKTMIRDFFYKYNDTNVLYIHDNEDYIDNEFNENPENNFDNAFLDQFD